MKTAFALIFAAAFGAAAFAGWTYYQEERAQQAQLLALTQQRAALEAQWWEEATAKAAAKAAALNRAVTTLKAAMEPCSTTQDLARIHRALEAYIADLPVNAEAAPINFTEARSTATALNLILKSSASDAELKDVMARLVAMKQSLAQ